MKKILLLSMPLLIVSNISLFSMKKQNITNNQIVWNLNINEKKILKNTGFNDNGFVANKMFNFDFLNYSTSLTDFINKYPHFKFETTDFVRGFIVGDDQTHYLTKTYNTAELQVNTFFVDILEVVNSSINSVRLETQLTEANNQFIFLIRYTSQSHFLAISPFYEVTINKLIFLT